MKHIFTLHAILLFICAPFVINSCSNEPNDLPYVNYWHRPLNHSSYIEGDVIEIYVVVRDNDGTVEQVEILLSGTSIALLNSLPYEFRYEVKNIQPGEYILEIIPTDDKGGQRSFERVIKVLPDLEEFTDTRDGNVYRYVTIGNQTWMADNLTFLPEVSSVTEGSDSLPHFYVYGYEGNDVSTAKQTEEYSNYGVLYNWEAAKQVSPEGWHLPTESEWQELIDYVGYSDMNSHLIHAGEGGTNQYGFSAVLAGTRNNPIIKNWIGGPFYARYEGEPCFSGLREETYWWSSNALSFELNRAMVLSDQNPEDGLSVRCIKD